MEIARASTSPKMKVVQIMKAAGETTGKVYESTLLASSSRDRAPKLAMHWAVPCISNLAKRESGAAPKSRRL